MHRAQIQVRTKNGSFSCYRQVQHSPQLLYTSLAASTVNTHCTKKPLHKESKNRLTNRQKREKKRKHNCAHPKYGQWAWLVLGLTTYLYCRFWVSYYGQSFAQKLNYTHSYLYEFLSSLHKVAPFALDVAPFCSLFFSSKSPLPLLKLSPFFLAFTSPSFNPQFPFQSLIYNLK